MPGDINTYSLGLELKLNAAPAMRQLDSIASQIQNIQDSLSKNINININNSELQANAEISQQSAEAQIELSEAVRTVQEGFSDLGVSVDESGLENLSVYSKEAHDNFDLIVGLQNQLDGVNQRFKDMSDAVVDINQQMKKGAGKELTSEEKAKKETDRINKIRRAHIDAISSAQTESELMWGLWDQFGPISSDTVKTIANVADSFGLLPKSMDFVKGSTEDIEKFQGGFGGIIEKGKQIFSSFTGSAGGVGEATEAMGEVGEVGGQALSSLGEGGGALNSLTSAMGSTGAAGEGLGAALGGAGAGAGAAAAGAAAAIPHVAAIQMAMEVAGKVAGGVADAMDAMGLSSTEMGKAISDGIRSMNMFTLATNMLKVAWQDFIAVQDEVRTTQYRVLGSIEETVDRTQEMRAELGMTKEEALGVMKGLVDSGMAARFAGKEFDEMAASVGKFHIATGIGAGETAVFASALSRVDGNIQGAQAMMGEFTVAMQKYGVTQSDVTAIMADAAGQAVEMEGRFGKTKDAAASYAKTLTALTAAFKKYGGSVEDAQKIMEQATDIFSDVSAITGAIGMEFDTVGDRVAYVAQGVYELTEGWDEMGPIMRRVYADMTGYTEGQIDQLHKMAKETGNVEEAMKKIQDEMEKTADLNKAFDESISTITQELKRLFEPILALLSTALRPLSRIFTAIMEKIKPMIGWFESFISVMDELGIISGFVEGALALIEPILAHILAVVFVLIQPLIQLGIMIASLGKGIQVLKAISKVVFAPFIIAVKLVWGLLKKVWETVKQVWGAIKKGWEGVKKVWEFFKGIVDDVVEAIEKGLKKAWDTVIKPITDVIKEIGKAFEELTNAIGLTDEESGNWADTLKDIAEFFGDVFEGLLTPIKGIAKAIGFALKPVVWALRSMTFLVKALKKLLFGSSFLHIKEGVAEVKGPLSWIVKMFSKLADAIKKIEEWSKDPFGKAVESAKNLASNIPLIGGLFEDTEKSAENAKESMKGSGFLGLDTLISDIMPYFGQFGAGIGGLGGMFTSQLPLIWEFFSSLFGPMKEFDGMMEGRKLEKEVDVTATMEPLEQLTYALTGKRPERARPVGSIMDQEMGRETKSERELKDLALTMKKITEPLETIVKLLESNADTAQIIEILKSFLPKISERPSELGPSVSLWG